MIDLFFGLTFLAVFFWMWEQMRINRLHGKWNKQQDDYILRDHKINSERDILFIESIAKLSKRIEELENENNNY